MPVIAIIEEVAWLYPCNGFRVLQNLGSSPFPFCIDALHHPLCQGPFLLQQQNFQVLCCEGGGAAPGGGGYAAPQQAARPGGMGAGTGLALGAGGGLLGGMMLGEALDQ